MAPAMSLVAERVRSVGVVSGAPRSCRRSEVFVGLFRFMLFFLCMGMILFRCRLGRQRQKHLSRPYRHVCYTPIAPVYRDTGSIAFTKLDHRQLALLEPPGKRRTLRRGHFVFIAENQFSRVT